VHELYVAGVLSFLLMMVSGWVQSQSWPRDDCQRIGVQWHSAVARARQANDMVDLSQGTLEGACCERLPNGGSMDGQGSGYSSPAVRDQSDQSCRSCGEDCRNHYPGRRIMDASDCAEHQIARNLTDSQAGAIIDRDTKDSQQFRRLIRDNGTKVIRLPPMSPNLNAYAERFVRSIKDECLNRMIFIGQASLRSGTLNFYYRKAA